MIAAALFALLSLAPQGDTMVASPAPRVGAFRVGLRIPNISPLFRSRIEGSSKTDDPMIIVFPPSVTTCPCLQVKTIAG